MRSGVRLVVCINRRLGAGQRSCAGSGSLALIERIERLIDERGLAVPIVRRECLGRCEQGPTMRIAPGGPFFTEIDEAALAVIVNELERFIAAGKASSA
jgi:(2Fe-2S) ferredoxin